MSARNVAAGSTAVTSSTVISSEVVSGRDEVAGSVEECSHLCSRDGSVGTVLKRLLGAAGGHLRSEQSCHIQDKGHRAWWLTRRALDD